MRINLERNDVITVCYSATLVMDKPPVVLYSRKDEASPRQLSKYYVCGLKFLSGIRHIKRWLAGNLGKCLLNVGWNTLRFRYHLYLPVEEMLPLGG
ncbi:MAG: hypothetical protein WAK13_01610 [Terriglobales bacterium]